MMTSSDLARVRLCALAALALLASASMSDAQDKTALSISVSSTVVSPGETVMVTLKSPANMPFAIVAVIWEKGFVESTTTLPATVPVHIPDDLRPGKYMISAMGRTAANEMVTVGTGVVVERTELPTRLSMDLSTIRFMRLGDEHPLRILADLPNAQVIDVTYSSHVTYRSSNPRVAIVEDTGMVMAAGPGSASVTATYTQGAASRRLVIPVTVPPPPFSVSPTPLDLGNVAIQSVASRNITLTNTTEGPLPIATVELGFQEGFTSRNTCTSSLPLAIGASCTITVTFAPARAGHLMTIVWLELDDDRIGLTVTGTGVSRE
jgi:HYDIN/CFA65/VesB family protein/Big-like domain-containing protein